MDKINKTWALSCLLPCFIVGGLAEQCGRQEGGVLCLSGLCCSRFGWCGNTYDYCGPGCQSQNYNYGPVGGAIGVNLLNNPDLVANNPVISFKTALWFWMAPQSPKSSSYDVITRRWTPSDVDRAAGRLPGYGTVTNIINGGLECGRGQDSRVADRIGFLMRYYDIFGVGYGDNLDFYSQTPFSLCSLIDVF